MSGRFSPGSFRNPGGPGWLAVALLLAATLGAVPPSFAQTRPVIRAATPADDFYGQAIGDLRRRLDGTAVVEAVGPAGAARAVEDVRRGELAVAVVPFAALEQQFPQFRVYDLPFIFTDGRSMSVFFSREGLLLQKDLRTSGMGALGIWYGGGVVVASRAPIRSPTDFRGMKLAVGSERSQKQFAAVGATAVRLQSAEVGQALSAGAIDAVELQWQDIAQLPLEHVYVAATDHRFAGHVVIFNLARWAALSPAVKQRLEDALEAVGTDVYKRAVGREQQSKSDALKSGRVRVLAVNDAVRLEWMNSLAGVQAADFALIDPELVKQARIRMVTAAAGREGGSDGNRWNAWFESDPNTVTRTLIPGTYRFTLDLGRGSYPGALSGAMGGLVAREIARNPDRAEIPLLVRPVLLGGVLAAAEGTSLGAQSFHIKRDRLVPNPQAAELSAALQRKDITLDAFADAMSVGKPVFWSLTARGTGCATVALAIWDGETGVRPLDYLVVKIPVQESGQPVPNCGAGLAGGELSAGLEGMLETGAPGGAGTRLADAALHLFDTGSDENAGTVAVYVDRSDFLAARAAGELPVLNAWQLPAPFSRFLSTPANLPQSIVSAHTGIATATPYAEVVRQMNNALFGGMTADDRQTAAKVRTAMQRLALREDAPVVVVRYVGSGGTINFVPLAMLAAQAPEPVLSHRLTVVQSMTGLTAPSPNACFGQWDFAIPRVLDGVNADERELLMKDDWRIAGERIAWVESNEALLNYFGPGPKPTVGTALVLLAHQGSGYITYSSRATPDRILETDRQREFADGSVAVLAACSTTGATLDNRVFVQSLGKSGMRAFIASPFQVDATFGTRFAVNFVAIAKEARGIEPPPRLIDLFDGAIRKTIASFAGAPGYKDMALEFQIIGDYELPLCKAPAPHG